MDQTLLFRPLDGLLCELEMLLDTINENKYGAGLRVLGGSSIGQHYRHVIGFFDELLRGYDSGVINYDHRERDRLVETDRRIAMDRMAMLRSRLLLPDKQLSLAVAFPGTGVGEMLFQTNYYRELLYNLEHVVHHMALIRVGAEALGHVALPDKFGVAESTIQSRKQCAQ